MPNVHHKVAYRCTHCGHLVPASAAGECHSPHSCPACGKGVRFTTDPGDAIAKIKAKHGDGCRVTRHNPLPGLAKLIEHDHWEVLADAADARLVELGLSRDDVEPPTRADRTHGPVRPPVMMAATGTEGAEVRDEATS